MKDERDIIELDQVNDDNTYTLDRRTAAEVLRFAESQDRAQLTSILEPLYAADISNLVEQISVYDRKFLLSLHARKFDGEILTELEEGVHEDIIALLKV